MNTSPLPRVLLVEDDPTSRLFLGNALRALPAEVDSADSLAAALTLAGAQTYDLWLFDAQLPDGDGTGLLARLRPRHPQVPAIAHTAADEPATLAALRGAGFVEVLVKPLPAAAVRAAVRRALGAAATAAPDTGMLWDDEAAAAALNGNRTHVDTLRGLFLAELPQARERIAVAARSGDLEALGDELHRLRASCGFVGATRLAATVRALQQQPGSAELLARFGEVAQATLAQADQTGSPRRSAFP